MKVICEYPRTPVGEKASDEIRNLVIRSEILKVPFNVPFLVLLAELNNTVSVKSTL